MRSGEASIKGITDILLQKQKDSLVSGSMAAAVQKFMIQKNTETSRLLLQQRIDSQYHQIDIAESRADYDADKPSVRWLFATKEVKKLIKEYEAHDIVVIPETETFLSPIVRYCQLHQ